MRFEWDESKRDGNLEDHGVDFKDAALIFESVFLEGGGRTQRLRRTALSRLGPCRRRLFHGRLHMARWGSADYQRMEGGR
jgi:uncharacterized DUF497 family protein